MRTLSSDVENYFAEQILISALMNGGLMQQYDDDRAGENLDIVLATFGSDRKIVLPDESPIRRLQLEVDKQENAQVLDFLVRTPSEYFKLLVYYCAIRSFDAMRDLYAVFGSQSGAMRQGSYNIGGDLQHYIRDLPEFLSSFQPDQLETIMQVTHIQSAAELGAVLFDYGTAQALRYLNPSTAQGLFAGISTFTGAMDLLHKEGVAKKLSRHHRELNLLDRIQPELLDHDLDLLFGQDKDENIEILNKYSSVDLDLLFELLGFTGGLFIPGLYDRLSSSSTPADTIRQWGTQRDVIRQGGFDPQNELHLLLEYATFKGMVNANRSNMHIKDPRYEDYLKIFGPGMHSLTDEQLFELDCVAYEASRLLDFLQETNEAAIGQGRRLVVIPNMSYGVLPLSPIVEHLESLGVRVWHGLKVGSSSCHDDLSFTPYGLFDGHREELMHEQPIVVIVDGTTHIDYQNPRYPDAYIGYLNAMIALNASTWGTQSYSGLGQENLDKLMESDDFIEEVDLFRQAGHASQPYVFGFWNVGGYRLAIRNNRGIAKEISPLEADDIRGPMFIFCNATLLDNDIQRQQGKHHRPAYFDDSSDLTTLGFTYDDTGVKIARLLEVTLSQRFWDNMKKGSYL